MCFGNPPEAAAAVVVVVVAAELDGVWVLAVVVVLV
jgi:hypothetical protein